MITVLVALTLLRLVVAGVTPLAPDEAYYWVWSRALAPGYLDHPPMVALWIRAGTALAGADPLGVRLLAPLSTLAGSALLVRAGRDLLGLDARGAWRAALLLNATLLVGAGAVTMTPDTPLLLFWTACLACAGRVRATGRTAWLVATGGCLGLAFCSKYTAILLAPALAAWLWRREGRAMFVRARNWAAALAALAVAAPVLAWNASHHFASLLKQGGRVAAFEPARAPRFLSELAVGQVGLATPILFALFCLGTARLAARARDRREDGTLLLLLSILVPLATFGWHALGARVQANWPAILYPAAALGTACLGDRTLGLRTRPLLVAGAALGFAATVLAMGQAATGALPVPVRLDPTAIRLRGWANLAAGAAKAAGGLPIAADEYGLAAELAWHAAAPRVLGVEPRWSLFGLPHPPLAGRRVLLLRSLHRRDPPDPARWSDPYLLALIARRGDGGAVVERYALVVATARATGDADALLPLRRTVP